VSVTPAIRVDTTSATPDIIATRTRASADNSFGWWRIFSKFVG
jgi:hypothetical protein